MFQGKSIIIMGVSGSGKTTVGSALARESAYEFIDGDDLHTSGNIEKMRSGIPLTDEDRQGWLLSINQKMVERNAAGVSLILACSALKKKYRDVLRQKGLNILFVYLKGSLGQIRSLLENRKGHFMPAGLLQSQFEALEEPEETEPDCITIPISNLPEELRQIRTRLAQRGF